VELDSEVDEILIYLNMLNIVVTLILLNCPSTQSLTMLQIDSLHDEQVDYLRALSSCDMYVCFVAFICYEKTWCTCHRFPKIEFR
jgi:hypothetical protein